MDLDARSDKCGGRVVGARESYYLVARADEFRDNGGANPT